MLDVCLRECKIFRLVSNMTCCSAGFRADTVLKLLYGSETGMWVGSWRHGCNHLQKHLVGEYFNSCRFDDYNNKMTVVWKRLSPAFI